MIVGLSELIDLLARQSKYYIQPGIPARTLFYARSGRAVSHATACQLLTVGRSINPKLDGVTMPDGSTIYAKGVIEALQSKIAQLEAENTRLRTDNVTLSRIAYRRILVGGLPQN